MTTRTDTKKFELLQSSPQVAILVHDFPQAPEASGSASPPPVPLEATREGSAGGKGGWADYVVTYWLVSISILIYVRKGSTMTHTVALHPLKTPAGNTYSITLNGVARVQGGAEAERYRAVHLRNNQGYAQFIEGPSIAVLTVHVTSARICNIQDRVMYWDAASAAREGGK